MKSMKVMKDELVLELALIFQVLTGTWYIFGWFVAAKTHDLS